MVDINTLTVRQLRAYITARGGDARGCVEKGDLRTLASSLAGRPDLSVKVCAECKAPAKTVCPDCQMLTYCGRSCAASDMGHQAVECPLTRRVRRREECEPSAWVDALPWAAALLDDAHGAGACGQALAATLASAGVRPDGYWRRAVGAHPRRPYGTLPAPRSAADAWGGMAAAARPPSTPLDVPPPSPLASWADYLDARGMPRSSLAPLLLHPARTVYAALAEALAAGATEATATAGSAGGGGLSEPAAAVVHLLGAEAELDALPLFAEVSHLLPMTDLSLVVIGPAVPASRDGKVVRLTPKETVRLVRGLYHTYAATAGWTRPTVVVALNAGLCAYPTWAPTVQLMADRRLVLIATDYIEFSAELPRMQYPLRVRGGGTWSNVSLNPFRQPKARCAHNSDLFPNYSNGFRVVFRGGA
ncbi:hypothetical protein I4F81_006215 [Pyropia yezoensis]|uniref:Uncharacterized protein n=1 Tax=Pyropia yezoensis TaxID=2788 RepID=A0ACC3C1M6_PYRYE|nr:hypothetical protein I4F81_006215 [Neopyropia yezoensis]